MKVNLVDDYSNEDYVIIRTDSGDFLAPKNGNGIFRVGDNNKIFKVSYSESTDVIDEWCHYVEQNRSRVSEALEDNDFTEVDKIIWSLKGNK